MLVTSPGLTSSSLLCSLENLGWCSSFLGDLMSFFLWSMKADCSSISFSIFPSEGWVYSGKGSASTFLPLNPSTASSFAVVSTEALWDFKFYCLINF